MKKAIVTALILGLVAASLSAPATAKKRKKPKRTERTVEGTYLTPSLIAVGGCGETNAIGCVVLTTGSTERFVTAKVTDAHGQPVFVSVQADTNNDMQDDVSFGSFCGETTAPIAVPSGQELHFWVGVTPDPAIAGCSPGEGTTGTVTATFSNLP